MKVELEIFLILTGIFYTVAFPSHSMKKSGQQPIRFNAKLPTTQETTRVDQGEFLTFPQFEHYNGYGVEVMVKQFENGTIQIGKGNQEEIRNPVNLFLTLNAESDWGATGKDSKIYVHHRSGRDGSVEVMKLPSFQGGFTLQVVSHSWMRLIYPGGEHKEQMWFTVDAETAFYNYTLIAFDLPNKYF